MRRTLRAAAIGLALAAPGCGEAVADPRDQWLIEVHTDALVPELGDRLLVEVLAEDDGACSGCRREHGVAEASAWPLSFGVLPEGNPRRVRARLYRGAESGPRGPRTDRGIDAIVALPAAAGVTHVRVDLTMRCFGVPADLAGRRSCDPSTGQLAPLSSGAVGAAPVVDSWGPGATTSCAQAPDPGMVCVPGGAFLLGDTVYLPTGDPRLDPVPEQLVEVAPFHLDRYEVTVADVRTAALPGMAPGTDAGCTYTVAPGEAEGQPVTCVSADFADAYCAKLGKRLPTEAEWEWAAGNLGRQTPHPWVDVASPCARAVVATTTGCNDGNGTPGPRAGGDARDVTALGVVNLGGNVSEWLADTLAPYAEGPCWGASVGLKVSPRCSSGAVRSIRGGSWFAEAFAARVTNRNGAPPAFRGPDLGFRCAR